MYIYILFFVHNGKMFYSKIQVPSPVYHSDLICTVVPTSQYTPAGLAITVALSTLSSFLPQGLFSCPLVPQLKWHP